MKYLEQRIEELELEVKLIKAKDKLGEIKINDYAFNPSVNLMSYPDLETAFASQFNNDEISKNQLDAISLKSESLVNDSSFNFDHYNYSDYPNIIGSWDDSFSSNPIEEKIKEKFGKIVFKFKILNHEWEMDGYGYVIDDGVDYRKIVVTDHGKLKIADKDYLANKIKEYEEIIKETKKAINLFK